MARDRSDHMRPRQLIHGPSLSLLVCSHADILPVAATVALTPDEEADVRRRRSSSAAEQAPSRESGHSARVYRKLVPKSSMRPVEFVECIADEQSVSMTALFEVEQTMLPWRSFTLAYTVDEELK